MRPITFSMIQNVKDSALEYAIAALHAHGSNNVVNDDHARLIEAMIDTMALTCLRRLPKRITIAADTGLAKSTSTEAFIAAVHEHVPADTGLGLIILHSQVAEGVEVINRTLSMAKDPEGLAAEIAHVHRKPEFPGVSPSEGSRFRFVFATHARAYRESMHDLLRWNGEMRGTIIDEGLHKADPFGVEIRDLRGAAGWASGYMFEGPHEDSLALRSWLTELNTKVNDAREGLVRGEHRMFRHEPPENVDRIITKLERLKRGKSDGVLDNIVGLLGHSNLSSEFRVIPQGVVQHRRALPEDLLSAVILDAGADIDRLQELDEEVETASTLHPGLWEGVPMRKDWSQVTVHLMKASSGRKTTDKAIEGDPEAKWLVDVFADTIRDVHDANPDWELLVCTLQPRKANAERVLKEAIADRGVKDSPRIKWITYGGDHRGSNAYRNARAVFSFGTWNISPLQATAAWLGAKGADRSTETPDGEEIGKVSASHTVQGLFQLMGRGNCRNVQNMVAGDMEFYYATNVSQVRQKLHARLNVGQPDGAKVVDWVRPSGSPRKSRADAESKDLESGVVDFLATTTRTSMTTTELWLELKALRAPRFKRTRALKRALRKALGWEIGGEGPAQTVRRT